jgi:tetratricopeptide (TPR) repeat protein
MLLATLLLSAVLAPQTPPAPPEKPAEPAPEMPTTPPAKPPAAPAAGLEAAELPPAPSNEAASDIEAGLKAFRKHRFARARDEFDKAVKADPQSAAANFYLGYVHYKLGEPSRRMNPDKKMAKELFAKAFQLDPSFQPVWGQKPPEQKSPKQP